MKDDNQANEALDTMLQAEAAAIKWGLRDLPDKIWDRLEAERCAPPPEAQMDFEDVGLAQTASPTPVERHRRSVAQPAKRPGKGGFVNGWKR